ncbi:hypothetical protein [Sphingorhabdus sp. EL138]|uniref:hypothetical protein n=1 Tax=Sphingorhabdus sp. EL138 TaxID=2073156 RepID=UPI0013A5A902|nr:hypothetical protein [Sphingorhabdus sp. EL138]
MIKASLTESVCTRRARDIYINTDSGTGVRCDRNTKVETVVGALTGANTEREAKDGFDLSARTTLHSGTGVNTKIDIIAYNDTFRLGGTVCEFDIPLSNIPLSRDHILSRAIRPIAPETARFIDHPKPQSGSA